MSIIDPDNPPFEEPLQIVAGSTARWRRKLKNYEPPTWSLTYLFANATDSFSISGADNGDGTHIIDVPPATTAAYVVGDYQYIVRATDGAEEFDVGTGSLKVKPNMTAAVDSRSHVKTVLDALQAMIEGKASKDQLSYSIQGRSLSRMGPEELMNWHGKYVTWWKQEMAADRLNKGLDTGNKIKVRFGAL